jgi:hypothetical protein
MAMYNSLVRFWPYNLELSFDHYIYGLAEAGVLAAWQNSLKIAGLTALFGTPLIFLGAWLLALLTPGEDAQVALREAALRAALHDAETSAAARAADAAIRAGLARLVQGEAITRADALEIFREIVQGAADPACDALLGIRQAVAGGRGVPEDDEAAGRARTVELEVDGQGCDAAAVAPQGAHLAGRRRDRSAGSHERQSTEDAPWTPAGALPATSGALRRPGGGGVGCGGHAHHLRG